MRLNQSEEMDDFWQLSNHTESSDSGDGGDGCAPLISHNERKGGGSLLMCCVFCRSSTVHGEAPSQSPSPPQHSAPPSTERPPARARLHHSTLLHRPRRGPQPEPVSTTALCSTVHGEAPSQSPSPPQHSAPPSTERPPARARLHHSTLLRRPRRGPQPEPVSTTALCSAVHGEAPSQSPSPPQHSAPPSTERPPARARLHHSTLLRRPRRGPQPEPVSTTALCSAVHGEAPSQSPSPPQHSAPPSTERPPARARLHHSTLLRRPRRGPQPEPVSTTALCSTVHGEAPSQSPSPPQHSAPPSTERPPARARLHHSTLLLLTAALLRL
ncbi:unnamed protein product [Gadus morhua 'NCC']